jgi:signal transduction histidine kinase
MSLPYAYTPQIWPSILMVVLMVALSFYSGRRRSVPGATPLMITSLFAAAWAAGSLLEAASLDLATRIAWFEVQAVIQLPVITGITCFILEYTWPGRWLTRRNLAWLSLPIILYIGMILTNDRYHLIWRSFSMLGTLRPEQGPGSWLMGIYFMGVLEALNLIAIGWLFLHSPQHRWPVALMVVGQFAGRTLFLIDRFYIPNSFLPLDLLGMSFEFLVYAIVLFGFRILDPIPLARQTVIQQLQTGMLVLDPLGRVVSSNPAASAFLGLASKRLLGGSIRDLLPAYAGLAGDLQAAGSGQVEISLPGVPSLARTPGTSRDDVGSGPDTRDYQLEVSPLKDWRGLEVGRLLLLRDVTDQKRAQVQLLEQQWAQATLQEREQLAHELHDGITQSLAFINVQAQAAQLYLQAEQVGTAQASISRLAQASRDLQGDMRELIGNLLAVSLPSEGFCATLRQVTARFVGQNQVPVCLEISDSAEALCDPGRLPAPVGVQLIRIAQEALANVRKHAGSPSQIQVQLSSRAGQLVLAVNDDGAGFDPQAASPQGHHFGLQVMQQRAAHIGGQLIVRSAPGKGTRVEVCVPVNGR